MSRRPGFQQIRDWLLLTVGLAGIVYEAVIYQGAPRWPLLTVYITMLGLPGALGLDALRERLSPSPPSPPSPPSSPLPAEPDSSPPVAG